MKFYRYFGSHAYETLLEKKMLVSRLSKFNDPFEFLFRSGGVMAVQRQLKMVLGDN